MHEYYDSLDATYDNLIIEKSSPAVVKEYRHMVADAAHSIISQKDTFMTVASSRIKLLIGGEIAAEQVILHVIEEEFLEYIPFQ